MKGEVENGQSVELDDGKWESVVVPHDWAIGKPFDMNIDFQAVKVDQDGEDRIGLRTGRTGALPCFGVGWYRAVVDAPDRQKGKLVFVEFDGQ